MTNTVQIKRSATTATPPTLAVGEPAYSELSGNFFIGESGNVISKIGGKDTVAAAAAALPSASFTAAAVVAKAITGYSSTTGTVADTDTIVVAISKLNGNVAAAESAAKSYADGLVVGLWDDRGNFDASGDAWPTSGGSGSAGAILKGDIWTISVAGTLGTVPVAARQTIRAIIDTPGATAANWIIGLANTDIDDSITNGVIGRAPSQNAVFDALALKADASGTLTTSSTVDGGSF